jgi:hypothetical protein
MPCHHKFIQDLQLQYVDWEVKTLFIGTFNPGWSECANNYAEWFYGRTQRNEFWCILPTIHENVSLLNGNRNSWIEFCRRNGIAITDIVASINDADPAIAAHRNAICKFKDAELPNFDITINDIPAILENHPSIKQICITRQQPLPPFWDNCFTELYLYLEQNPQREIELKYLRSPSRGARRGVVGPFCQFVAARWLAQGYLINP